MSKISVLIPTYNEEKYIENCLKSVSWAEEIIIVDSFSTDNTLDICKKYSDKILQHEYVNSATQKNWSLQNLDFAGDWIMIIDADEQVPIELRDEILSRVGKEEFAGYYFPRKNYFLGKWLKYGHFYPDWSIKLFKKGAAKFENKCVHAEAIVEGKVGYMKNPLIHYPWESISDYVQHVNKFTDWRAQDIYRSSSGQMEVELVSYPKFMRPWLKIIWRYLPLKPFFRFLWFYIFKLGFLDGYRGFLLAVLEGWSIYLAYAKCWEIREREKQENG